MLYRHCVCSIGFSSQKHMGSFMIPAYCPYGNHPGNVSTGLTNDQRLHAVLEDLTTHTQHPRQHTHMCPMWSPYGLAYEAHMGIPCGAHMGSANGLRVGPMWAISGIAYVSHTDPIRSPYGSHTFPILSVCLAALYALCKFVRCVDSRDPHSCLS